MYMPGAVVVGYVALFVNVHLWLSLLRTERLI